MASILAFLKLIRLPNLLMIALVQYLVRFFIIIPKLSGFFKPQVVNYLKDSLGSSYPLIRDEKVNEVIRSNFVTEIIMNDLHFFLFSLSTIMIAASGYIINDYFDLRTDAINKPNKLLIDLHIKRRVAMGAHLVIGFIAVLLGFYIAWHVGNWQLGTIHGIIFVLLWFYSTNYKQRFLIGNILIALFSALIILLVGVFERGLYTALITDHSGHVIVKDIMMILLVYSLFAFIISLIREIVKDIEDIEGDRDISSQTIPIILGIKRSKIVIYSLIITFIGLLGYVQILGWDNYSRLQQLYILLTIQLPALFAFFLLYKAHEKQAFNRISQLVKVIMLTGILSIVVLWS